jgi:hypothetical protein
MTPVSGRAQQDALKGTWSGGCHTKAGYEACTVRFESDGVRFTGRMLSPTKAEFTSVTFDPKTLKVVATTENSEDGSLAIQATIKEETRLHGTVTQGDMTGKLLLTKWTFRP